MTSQTTAAINLPQALRVAQTLVLVMRGAGHPQACQLQREALNAHGSGDLTSFVAFALAREVVEDCLAGVHPFPEGLQGAADLVGAELATAQGEAADLREEAEAALVSTLLDFLAL